MPHQLWPPPAGSCTPAGRAIRQPRPPRSRHSGCTGSFATSKGCGRARRRRVNRETRLAMGALRDHSSSTRGSSATRRRCATASWSFSTASNAEPRSSAGAGWSSAMGAAGSFSQPTLTSREFLIGRRRGLSSAGRGRSLRCSGHEATASSTRMRQARGRSRRSMRAAWLRRGRGRLLIRAAAASS